MSTVKRRTVLISPTAYKGTLTPTRAALAILAGLKKNHPNWIYNLLPLADGGDGTLEVLMAALKGRRRRTRVKGPLDRPVWADWAVLTQNPFPSGKTAVIEMARASGLALVKGKNRIMEATSFGTGQLIKAALNEGCRNILIGVGGTATGEGGAGALQALGLAYKDRNGNELSGTPRDLLKLCRLDWSHLDPRLKKSRIYVLCDVTNPLLGPKGSARTFGSQKGATKTQVSQLEKALARWSTFARRQTKQHSGAGAAGALAYGLSAFLGAKLVKGSPFLFKLVGWNKAAQKADIIVTGEGKIDTTSFSGKVIGEILRRKGSARVMAICGDSPLSITQLRRRGLARVIIMGREGLHRPAHTLRSSAIKLV